MGHAPDAWGRGTAGDVGEGVVDHRGGGLTLTLLVCGRETEVVPCDPPQASACEGGVWSLIDRPVPITLGGEGGGAQHHMC